MTSNPLDRTSLNAWRMALARVGSVIVSGATIWLVAWTGDGDEAKGYFLTVLGYGCLAALLYLACFATTHERISASAKANPVATDLKMLVRNRPWIILFILGIVLFANMVVSLSSTIYYVRSVIGEPSMIGTFMLAGSLATFLGVPFTKASVRRFGKKPTFIAAQCGVAILMAVMYYVPTSAVPMILAVRTAAFALIWFSSPLLWTMIGDSADYGECRLGVRATGVIFSAATCAHKMGMGLGGAIVGWMLAVYGYADVAVQSQSTIEGIKVLHCLIPAMGSLMLAALMTTYPLSDADCDAMERELGAKLGTSLT
jgi:GPH family glycoside/pentoside/hexuronide:cation symporter